MLALSEPRISSKIEPGAYFGDYFSNEGFKGDLSF